MGTNSAKNINSFIFLDSSQLNISSKVYTKDHLRSIDNIKHYILWFIDTLGEIKSGKFNRQRNF